MKIFSSGQLREADHITIQKQGITSADLMERAGKKVFDWIANRYGNAIPKIHFFCGMGNNGGDGLVVARHLLQHGYPVAVYLIPFSQHRSADFTVNLERLQALPYTPIEITSDTHFPPIQSGELIIDAIFGIGFRSAPELWVGGLLKRINAVGAIVISIDSPSGLCMDAAPADREAVVRATITLSFQAPKLVFFLPQTGEYAGRWEVLDIGLDEEYLSKTSAQATLIDLEAVRGRYRPREKFSHKGTYGHALLIGGSYGKMGAMVLAARACIGSGAGLVTAYIPQCGYTVLQGAVPEVMTVSDTGKKHIQHVKNAFQPSAVGLGMGMGTKTATRHAFARFIRQNKAPLVIDADGLNMLAQEKTLLKHLPAKTILTPHPKELERLIGAWKDDFDKLEKVKQVAREYELVMVVKGAHTIIADGEKLYVNTTGNPGMATAGSGDALTGVITAWLAQGYAPADAAALGVYLHGKAGDIAGSQIGYEALTATALIKNLGAACVASFPPAG